MLLAAKGIQSIKPRWLAGVALLTTVSLPASVLTSYYQFRSRNHEWKTVTDHVLVQARPGDAVIFYVAPRRLCFDYYRAKYEGSSKGLDVVYPEFGDENRDPSALLYMPPMRSDLTDYVATRYRRVWVVLYHDEFAFTSGLSRRIQDSLSAKYHNMQESTAEGQNERVRLLLYANGSDDQEASPSGLNHEASALSNRP
jgi:hypothetical protein